MGKGMQPLSSVESSSRRANHGTATAESRPTIVTGLRKEQHRLRRTVHHHTRTRSCTDETLPVSLHMHDEPSCSLGNGVRSQHRRIPERLLSDGKPTWASRRGDNGQRHKLRRRRQRAERSGECPRPGRNPTKNFRKGHSMAIQPSSSTSLRRSAREPRQERKTISERHSQECRCQRRRTHDQFHRSRSTVKLPTANIPVSASCRRHAAYA